MRIVHTAIKMTLVTLIAGLISKWIGLDYWLTGGVLALLSIQLTKRDSLIIAFRRIIDVFFGMVLSVLLFVIFGYDFWVFIIIVFIFSLSSFKLNISEGIVPALVIITHLLVYGEFSFPFILEESLLVIISISTAAIFNTLYPSLGESELIKYTKEIDQYIRDHLLMLSFLIKDPQYAQTYNDHYLNLGRELKKVILKIELLDKDLLFQNNQSYLSYAYMRKTQATYMKHMYDQASKITCVHKNAIEISEFIKDLSYDVGLYDQSFKYIKNIDALLEKYRSSELPKTREEFESRAILFQILIELESLIQVNLTFYETHQDFLSSV
ncbi:MAG: hypothetical protein K8Q99_03575 [Acholeplasmataceae bacterium]|nr:hypothetical protein [Acholeplasmataceae bacterium]